MSAYVEVCWVHVDNDSVDREDRCLQCAPEVGKRSPDGSWVVLATDERDEAPDRREGVMCQECGEWAIPPLCPGCLQPEGDDCLCDEFAERRERALRCKPYSFGSAYGTRINGEWVD